MHEATNFWVLFKLGYLTFGEQILRPHVGLYTVEGILSLQIRRSDQFEQWVRLVIERNIMAMRK